MNREIAELEEISGVPWFFLQKFELLREIVSRRRRLNPGRNEAIRDVLRAFFFEPLTMDFTEEIYIAANSLARKHPQYKRLYEKATLQLQQEIMES